MSWILLSLAVTYLLLLAGIAHLWFHKKPFSPVAANAGNPFISIVIPARNEEEELPRLLESIKGQQLSDNSYEIIVVDDHSTDRTAELARGFPKLKCISLTGTPGKNNKKRCIQAAIEASRGEIVLTTDADCIWPDHLITTVKSYFREQSCDVLCGPVSVASDQHPSFLHKFEQIDMAGMMLVTLAGIESHSFYLGNGAFLAYKKSGFLEVDPFRDNWQEASGDDVFLTKAMAKAGKKVDFLKARDLIVQTHPNGSWQDFIQQRLRWSQKNKKLARSPGLSVAMGIPFVFCLCLILFSLLGPFFPQLWPSILIAWGAKVAADLLLFLTMRSFFSLKIKLWEAILLSPLHCLYIAAFGFAGLFHFSYEWKSVKV